MTPINAFNDPNIGAVLLLNRDLVRGYKYEFCSQNNNDNMMHLQEIY